MRITCPRCQETVDADVPEGTRVQCPTCSHKFETERPPQTLPKSSLATSLPAKWWNKIPMWAWIFVVMPAVFVVMTVVAGIMATSMIQSGMSPAEVRDAMMGLIILAPTALILFCWVVMPVVVVVRLGQIRKDLQAVRWLMERK